MGLFGALVVRPALGAALRPTTAPTASSRPREEFMVLLSEIDPYQHQAVESGLPFNLNNYHPRYWLLNGRGFPDTHRRQLRVLAAEPALRRAGADPLLQHQVPPTDPNYHPYPGLIRYLNVGTENYPFHPHGNNGLVIGRDGRALEGPAGEDLSFEKFAVNIGPGQTWDVIFQWYDAEGYSSATNPVPVTIPDIANLVHGMFYSGSPYLGEMGPLPARHLDAQPVRRVLHHLPQPRPVPDHVLGHDHGRPDHLPAGRSALCRTTARSTGDCHDHPTAARDRPPSPGGTRAAARPRRPPSGRHLHVHRWRRRAPAICGRGPARSRFPVAATGGDLGLRRQRHRAGDGPRARR